MGDMGVSKREGEAVRPCNFHTKQFFLESPLKAKSLKVRVTAFSSQI